MKAIIDAIKTKSDLALGGVKVVYFPPIDTHNRSRIESAKVYADGVHIMTYVYPLYRVDKTIYANDSTFVSDIIAACKVSLEWMAKVDAVDCHIKEVPLRHHSLGLSYTATGYGRKIPTRYKVYYNGLWRRVYSACYSNVSTEFIETNGKTIPVFM